MKSSRSWKRLCSVERILYAPNSIAISGGLARFLPTVTVRITSTPSLLYKYSTDWIAEVARDALKDIIIHLQQQVITNLKTHWEQDTFVDFAALQDVSGSSQGRAMLILMQLQQRIVMSAPIQNSAPPPSKVPAAHDQRSLPALPALPQANHEACMDLNPASGPIQENEGHFAFTAPPSRQNAQPLTPPHSPEPQSVTQAQEPTAQMAPAQIPSTKCYLLASYSPAASAPESLGVNLPKNGGRANAHQFSHSDPHETHRLPPLAFDSMSSNSHTLDQAPSSQYSSTQPSQAPMRQDPIPETRLSQSAAPHAKASQDFAPQQPVNFRYETPHSTSLPVPAGRDGSQDFSNRDFQYQRKDSGPIQYRPIATTTEKTGLFGIRKKKIERVPEPLENPLVDQYAAAAIRDKRRGNTAAASIQACRSTSPSSQDGCDLSYDPRQLNDEPAPLLNCPGQNHNAPPALAERLRPNLTSLRRTPTQQSHHSSNSNHSDLSNIHVEVLSSNRSINSINPKDLLPNELNQYAGFCKGAWRQQIGDRKKATEDRVRPGGMYHASKYLQCKSCKFEGRYVPDNKRQGYFDSRVLKIVEGIQFRWEFLFKSHVMAKNEGADALKGSFGCMFCCAEGRGTPTFQGVTEFMGHLVEHRSRLPTGEVLYRMNCLVGRTSGPDEDFDINIVSREGGVS